MPQTGGQVLRNLGAWGRGWLPLLLTDSQALAHIFPRHACADVPLMAFRVQSYVVYSRRSFSAT